MGEIIEALSEQQHSTAAVQNDFQVHPLDWDSPEKLKTLVEGALFASAEPVAVRVLQQLFPDEARPSIAELEASLIQLQADYADRAVGLELTPLGYRFQVRTTATALVKTMLIDKPPKFSRASMETLALIAYRQPITRGEIEEVRGVSVSSQILKTLEEREWVRVVGHKEVPGRPALWATTPTFLAYFGLNNLEDLPPLAPISGLKSADFDVSSTPVNSDHVRIIELEDELANADLEEPPTVPGPVEAEMSLLDVAEDSSQDFKVLCERLRQQK